MCVWERERERERDSVIATLNSKIFHCKHIANDTTVLLIWTSSLSLTYNKVNKLITSVSHYLESHFSTQAKELCQVASHGS